MASEDKPVTDLNPVPPRESFSGWRDRLSHLQTFAIAIVLALLLRIFVAEPRYIPSDSMFPTLKIGDRVVIEKISYNLHPPQRGDIVVFSPPPQLQRQGYKPDQAFIKRIIGEAEHTVSVRNQQVYIDDQALPENYIAEAPAYDLDTLPIPPQTVFVMGDNRNNSNDSHIWGVLPNKQIIGRAIFRFWPLNRIGWV
ncbi:MAG: signal peptidase I [Jaaginema sp. PMC 1079.18]|nr:signal peptidase I [Jaaginema sp. PMC 1080.18]MEC4853104.1 signal peptidase I [Jaaginema sp. PMC 1079.18]MEC4867075.1 signal peptidase I [Jaaginema sp. PMC 1078.18]